MGHNAAMILAKPGEKSPRAIKVAGAWCQVVPAMTGVTVANSFVMVDTSTLAHGIQYGERVDAGGTDAERIGDGLYQRAILDAARRRHPGCKWATITQRVGEADAHIAVGFAKKKIIGFVGGLVHDRTAAAAIRSKVEKSLDELVTDLRKQMAKHPNAVRHSIDGRDLARLLGYTDLLRDLVVKGKVVGMRGLTAVAREKAMNNLKDAVETCLRGPA